MSSTTDPNRRDRGQTLVIFTLFLIVLLAIGALVFDVGQSLSERRSRQDVADAAALAGARYLPVSQAKAEQAAIDLAKQNGYEDGVNGMTVTVSVPPGPETKFAGLPGYIEVQISGSRAASFSGVIGITEWKVGALAVAANQAGVAAPYAMLALDPTACKSAKFSGNGDLDVSGSIQVNSECEPNALNVSGKTSVTVAADASCNIHGEWDQDGTKAELTCPGGVNEGAPVVPDPLADLIAPPVPPLANPVVPISSGGLSIPTGCPGSDAPATAEDPATCSFTSSYKDTMWRLSPGYYPGGISVQAGTILLSPGIYYLGGGGFQANGTEAFVISVDAGATAATLGGGVLLYNSEDSSIDHPTGVAAISPITLNGSEAKIQLLPLDIGSRWDGLVIFQDRSFPPSESPTITINGDGALLSVTGTLYAPTALVKVTGSDGSAVTTQVIANQFDVTGNGSFTVNYDADSYFQFKAQGLVQ